MKISLASDHAGFPLKRVVKDFLTSQAYEIQDFGTGSTEAADLSDHAYPAAMEVSRGHCERAILIDGAGYPSGIIANMLPNVYAAVANDLFSARLSREHSNANVLCLGGKVIGEGVALEIISLWLKTDFLGGKYAGRVGKVAALGKRHRQPADPAIRKVVTVQDVRDALTRKESLLLDGTTIITPAVQDLLRCS
jgi:ribose 5-phosphate isomerase B